MIATAMVGSVTPGMFKDVMVQMCVVVWAVVVESENGVQWSTMVFSNTRRLGIAAPHGHR